MSDTGINNSYRRKRKQLPDVEEISKKIIEGNNVALSQAITLVESTKKEHQDLASKILNKVIPHSGNSIRIGITGVPGVGKSTFIESFGQLLVKGYGKKVAVLAVDPSSQKSRGSILGDKTRMEELVKLDEVFVRPSPAGATLGGVAQKTREAIFLCEAAGYDVILIETVGVGQSEIAVKSMVDYFLLLMLAGAGDELQGIKRGIMEMADTIVITKADSGNEDNAIRAKREYQNAVHLFPPHESRWTTKVLTCSSMKNKGLDKVYQNVEEYEHHIENNGFKEKNRADQSMSWFHEKVKSDIVNKFYDKPEVIAKIKTLEEEISRGEKSSFSAAIELLGEE